MKPVPFAFERPEQLAGAFKSLGGEGSKVLAGGQSLLPMLNLRLLRPERLVDIHALPELRRVRDDGEGLVYGAAITHAMIEDGLVPDATPGWLPVIAGGIAYRAVRNRGTIGGSLVHADPAADWVSTLTALGGEAILASPSGERALPLTAFIRGPFTTALEPGEILSGVRLPKRGAEARWGYWKFCRKVGEFAKAIGALLVDPERGETRAVIGAIERPPHVIEEAEALVEDPRAALELTRAALPDLAPAALQIHAAALERAARLALDGRAAA